MVRRDQPATVLEVSAAAVVDSVVANGTVVVEPSGFTSTVGGGRRSCWPTWITFASTIPFAAIRS